MAQAIQPDLPPPPPPIPTPSGRAPRGSACLNCRRRKLRCDGVRPICGQCVRTNREADCEYTDGPMPSATQVLEEDIVRLEARIFELEHPESVPSSVLLHDPRAPPRASSSTAPSLPIVGLSAERAQIPTQRPFQGGPAPPGPTNAEPPMQVVQMLVGYFLPHASQVGFFLHTPRFLQAVYTPDPEARVAQLSPALLNAVYLWGTHLSSAEALLANEPVFLSRTVRAISAALGHVPPYNMIHTIQAETLLASYFFSVGRFLEGRFHCSAAVALALSCRLNKIRALPDMLHTDLVDAAQFALPPPADVIEEGERINAFWTVYILDKSWAVALGSGSHINGGTGAQVDTPWPLEIEDYEHGGLILGLRGSRTMQTFLRDIPAVVPGGTSPMALRAQAVALFDRATRLSSQWTPTMANVDQFSVDFFMLDTGIDRFAAALPPVARAGTPQRARDFLVTHTFAHAATIQLYSNFRDAEGLQESKDLRAARGAAGALDGVDLAGLGYVDPVLAILWTAVCRALIGETARLRTAWVHSSMLSDDAGGMLQYIEGQQAQVATALQRVLGAIAMFGHAAPLMGAQAAKIQQEIEAAAQ